MISGTSRSGPDMYSDPTIDLDNERYYGISSDGIVIREGTYDVNAVKRMKFGLSEHSKVGTAFTLPISHLHPEDHDMQFFPSGTTVSPYDTVRSSSKCVVSPNSSSSSTLRSFLERLHPRQAQKTPHAYAERGARNESTTPSNGVETPSCSSNGVTNAEDKAEEGEGSAAYVLTWTKTATGTHLSGNNTNNDDEHPCQQDVSREESATAGTGGPPHTTLWGDNVAMNHVAAGEGAVTPSIHVTQQRCICRDCGCGHQGDGNGSVHVSRHEQEKGLQRSKKMMSVMSRVRRKLGAGKVAKRDEDGPYTTCGTYGEENGTVTPDTQHVCAAVQQTFHRGDNQLPHNPDYLDKEEADAVLAARDTERGAGKESEEEEHMYMNVREGAPATILSLDVRALSTTMNAPPSNKDRRDGHEWGRSSNGADEPRTTAPVMSSSPMCAACGGDACAAPRDERTPAVMPRAHKGGKLGGWMSRLHLFKSKSERRGGVVSSGDVSCHSVSNRDSAAATAKAATTTTVAAVVHTESNSAYYSAMVSSVSSRAPPSGTEIGSMGSSAWSAALSGKLFSKQMKKLLAEEKVQRKAVIQTRKSELQEVYRICRASMNDIEFYQFKQRKALLAATREPV